MDKRDALDIAIKYANAVKIKYDFVKLFFLVHMQKATTIRIAILILQ
jgi:hypothetical protein